VSITTPDTQQQRSHRSNRLGSIIGWALIALWVLSNILWILTEGNTRDALTIAGVTLLFAASLTHSLNTRGAAWTLACFAIACGFGWAIEALGTTTGWPFGEYEYTDRLGPHLGAVPLLIPMAWAMMAYPIYAVVERTGWNRLARIALAAGVLATWDLFLDPQMVAEGHWVWRSTEPAIPGLPGIPISNYLGWIIAALILMSLLTLLLPARPGAPIAQPMTALTWVYIGNIMANAVFLGRPAVALVGGVAMGIPMAILVLRLRTLQLDDG
jgi:uncharacterized membrane protein